MGKNLLRRGASMIGAGAVVVGVVVGGAVAGAGTASAHCVVGANGGCDNKLEVDDLPESVREFLLAVLTVSQS